MNIVVRNHQVMRWWCKQPIKLWNKLYAVSYMYGKLWEEARPCQHRWSQTTEQSGSELQSQFHLKKVQLSLRRLWGPWRQTWTVVGEPEALVHHDHDPLLARRNQRLRLEQTHSTAPSRSQMPCHSRFQAGLDHHTPRTISRDSVHMTHTHTHTQPINWSRCQYSQETTNPPCWTWSRSSLHTNTHNE